MNIYQRLFLISTFSQLMQKTNSEHLLPVFTGLWFDTNSVHYDGTDSCSMEAYKYDNFYFSPMEVLENFYGSDCSWDYTTFINDYNYTTEPSGFISPNADDWKMLMLDPNTTYEGVYRMLCTSKKSGLKNTYSVIAVPYYDCPPSTRLSLDNITLTAGCTTLPIPCLADIVARDLSIPGLTVLGHVGLVSDIQKRNPHIMQVLNNDEGIVFAPLYGNGSFSDIGEYWGERYGLQQQLITRLPMNTAVDIINAGSDQKHYHFNYTCSWDYYPGGTLEHPDSCLFRCDSFVYYCYDAAGLKIQESFTYPTTIPYTIFHYDFPCSANPAETCVIIPEAIKNNSLNLSEADDDIFCVSQTGAINVPPPTVEIFSKLRPILLAKKTQSEQLPRFIKQYKERASISEIELLVRCICFELNRMSPEQISDEIRPLLSNLFWQYRYLSEDNFVLAITEKRLNFYSEKPSCKWLNAFFTIKATTLEDKEVGMIAYIDQQNVVDKANLVSASRLSHLHSLSQEKKCEYGMFFQKAYRNYSLSEKERHLLWLGLSEIKYPGYESKKPGYKC